MPRVIDSHHHFWKSAAQDQPWRTHEHAVLERDFESSDLLPELDAVGIDATVLMQSVDEVQENDRLATYAQSERVAGVVAWLPLISRSRSLAELERIDVPKLAGVRCLVAKDPLAWLSSPESISLFEEVAERGLAWDVVPITSEQVQAVLRLARAVPNLRIVIDHLGRPPIESLGWEPWATHLRDLAACPNVSVKVSVGIDALTKWDSWDPSALSSYVGHLADEFGPRRLMLGSNWPVILLRSSYEQAWRDLVRLVNERFSSDDDRNEVSGGTAERVYRLVGARLG